MINYETNESYPLLRDYFEKLIRIKGLLEEVSECRKIQRLTETAWARKQSDQTALFYYLTDKIGLIHIIIILADQQLVITDTDR